MDCIQLPPHALVVLVGSSGSGKSTFARRHFSPFQIVSSDHCRGVIADDPASLEASADAFDLLRHILRVRLRRGLLTVVDSTAVEDFARHELVELGREYRAHMAAVVFDIPEELCCLRDASRSRSVGAEVIAMQKRFLNASMARIPSEGWDSVTVLTPETQETMRVRVSETLVMRRSSDAA
jgi:predicted kinase